MTTRVLILGGTGVLSSGITRACRRLGYDVCHFRRGQTPDDGVATIQGDRYTPADLARARAFAPDVVIDMLGFTAQHAELAVEAFGGAVKQLIFCSTACVYDIRQVPGPLSERAPLGSHWHYGANKLACEQIYMRAHAAGLFQCTVFRPSHVYSDAFFVHQLGFDGALLVNRLLRGLPVLVFDGGQQLWQACHHDDVGVAFAHACLRAHCYGQVYNLGYRETFTWRACYERIAGAFGVAAQIHSLPADALPQLDPAAYEFLINVSRYHFAVDPARLYSDIPEFTQRHQLEDGARAFWRRVQAGDALPAYAPALAELAGLGARDHFPETLNRYGPHPLPPLPLGEGGRG